ncbi:MAG: hypothetical protein JWQ02_4264, partial [Capsulimonas sp.]|nr:hypothetical protein [Capsulimonas sp.]
MNLTKRKVRQKRILTDAERLKRRTRRRAVACVVMLPPCAAGLFGLTIGYNIWAGNKAVADTSQFHKMAPPTAAQSLLVFAPHCDDETLGAAGLMRQTLLNKGDVHVAILTNGDGFRVSVAREFRELSVPTKDFIRYAYIRQKEAQTALGVLGVPKSNIQFFGYPDRGLMPMWTTNWSADEPFTSAFTQADHCPYDNSYTPKAAYCGESLLKDIESQMNAVKPTDIYVTHPNDDHPDHAAASVFVRTALEQLRSQGVGWAQHAQLHYYLVHRGDWPVPQGLHEDVGLPPPAQMVSLDTHWEEFPLTKRDTQRKYAAIKRYRTQTELTGRFLYSFVRKNELFGTLNGATTSQLPRVPDGQIRLDGELSEWTGLAPVAMDPVGDSVVRAFQASADITRIFAARDSQTLFVRMDVHKHLSKSVGYTIVLRPVTSSETAPKSIRLTCQMVGEGRKQPIPGVDHAYYAWSGNQLEVALPLSEVDTESGRAPFTLNIAGET